jgi:hypothetical protein
VRAGCGKQSSGQIKVVVMDTEKASTFDRLLFAKMCPRARH